MLKLFLIENTEKRVSYDYYSDDKKAGQPQFKLAQTDINNTNASMVFSKIRKCNEKGEFPQETMVVWY